MKIATALTWSRAMKCAPDEDLMRGASSRFQHLQNLRGRAHAREPRKGVAHELRLELGLRRSARIRGDDQVVVEIARRVRSGGDADLGRAAAQEVEQQQATALGAHRGAPRMISAQSFFHFASSSRTTAGSTNLSGSFCAGSATRRLAGT